MTTFALSQQTTADISIVIPILNEAESLPRLLKLLLDQSFPPREIIVVDSGSSDGSIGIVERWAWESAVGAGRCRVIVNLGGMPGGNRNCGVAAAKGEWIAFLDGGIVPEPDWLARLAECAEATGSKAVFGQCHFDADATFEKAVCALSYGCGAIHPVLPASLFHRSVFEQAGWFNESLRSAEDILWLREVERHFGPRRVCEAALVHYSHFPTSVAAAVRKWGLYERNSVRAGLRGGQQGVWTGFFSVLLLCLIAVPSAGVTLLLAYILVRGLIDPIRRSHAVHWWGDKPAAALVAMGLGVVLDVAKTLGGLTAHLRRKIEGKHAV